MTYQTLYRKYRSQTFSDLVGQEATRRALQGAILSGRVAHAYLFSGTRGTGKTSTARLLAKALNCADRPADSAEPCGRCESCRQVAGGTALDLIEIDAASNRGIDEIRDLREKVNLAPALGGRKIYIIDEAHMLTSDAFNALLKTLEEPPEHVVFILCTTEANKVPPTVVGRCQQFTFRRLSEEQISGRLRHIADVEGIDVDADAVGLIARSAQGSMRDAIGLLDQLVPLADGPITASTARELLGGADPERLRDLLDHVLEGRASAALDELSAIYAGGGELRQVVRELMELCRDRLVAAMEARDEPGRERLAGVLDALLHLDGEVRRHGEPRLLVEATLVRLAVDARAPAAATAPVAAAPVATAAAAAATVPPVAAAAPGPEAEERAIPAAVEPWLEADSPPASAPAAVESTAAGGWAAVLRSLTPKTRAYFVAARSHVEGDRLVLSFPYSFHHQMASENRAELDPLVKAWLGDSASLELRLEEPAAAASGAVAAAPLAPEEDPLIKAAERKLEARVVRVRPLKPGE